MICSNCGKEIGDGSKFCGFCGSPQQVAPMQQPLMEAVPMQQPVLEAAPVQQPVMGTVPPMQQPMMGAVPPAQPKKKGKAGLIIVLILVVLLLAGGGVFAFLWMNRPITKVADAFAEDDIDKVIELYDEVSEKDKAQVEEQAGAYALALIDGYVSGTDNIKYKNLSKTLEALCEEILAENDEVAEQAALAAAVNTSREAFEKAENYKENYDYTAALAAYAEVIEEDGLCYSDAQKAIEEIGSSIREDAISDAEYYMSWGDYSDAKRVLEDTLILLPGDTRLEETLKSVEEAELENEISSYIDDAEWYISYGYYSDAMEILEDAMELYPNNAALQEAIDTLTEQINEEYPLLGTWSFQFDVSELIAEEAGLEEGVVEKEFIVDMIFEFTDYGTYTFYVEEESFKEGFKDWFNAYIDYEVEEMCDELGCTEAELDILFEEEYGMGFREYVNEVVEGELDSEMDDLLSDIITSGVYETEGDKLYMDEYYIDYSTYDIFTIDGDTLTLSLAEGKEFDSGIPGVEYPFELTRVK